MKKIFVIVFFVHLITLNICSAQITFEKKITGLLRGGTSRICEQTLDSGFIVAATATVLGQLKNACVLTKFTATGDTSWTKIFLGEGNYNVTAVYQLRDGGYLIGGDTAVFVAGNYCMFLIRTDAAGNRIWTKTYGPSTDWTHFRSADETQDGGFVLVGSESAYGAGEYDILLVRTDENGDTLWTRTYGGPHYDDGQDVMETSQKDLLVTGYFRPNSSVNDRMLVMKCDSSGNTIWAKTFGGTHIDRGLAVCEASDGNFLAVGLSNSFGHQLTIGYTGSTYIVKFDTNGDTLWTKAYINTIGSHNFGNSIRETQDAGYIIAGNVQNDTVSTSKPDALMLKIDSSGNPLWAKGYGGLLREDGYTAMETTDGGYLLCGVTDDNEGIYIVKTDSLGNSFCNDSSIVFTAASTPTLVTNVIPLVYSGVVVSNPVIRDSSGTEVVTYCSTVDIGPASASATSQIKLFPNPARSEFTVLDNSMNLSGQIEVYDVVGKKILQREIQNGREVISCSNFGKGIYFVRIVSGSENFFQKLLVE